MYLGELLGSIAVARHWPRDYAGLVATEAKRRKAIQTAVQILRTFGTRFVPAERIIPAARERLDAARAGRQTRPSSLPVTPWPTWREWI